MTGVAVRTVCRPLKVHLHRKAARYQAMAAVPGRAIRAQDTIRIAGLKDKRAALQYRHL
jgi:hypothetical protein